MRTILTQSISVYDMGFLATAEVIECSATDLIAQYVGQTGPKVQKQLDRGLGKVLFIDEAYRLAEGPFAKEAVDELVDAVTKDKYAKRLVIILAGYEADINRLMAINAGLTSRFPEVINFRSLTPDECTSLLLQELEGQQAKLKARDKRLDVSALEAEDTGAPSRSRVSQLFGELSQCKDWASARDVKEAGRAIFRSTIQDKESLATGSFTIRVNVVYAELEKMLQERRSRQTNTITNDLIPSLSQPAPFSSLPVHENPLYPVSLPMRPSSATRPQAPSSDKYDGPSKQIPEADRKTETNPGGSGGGGGDGGSDGAARDAGVSDAVWEQLQRDRRVEEQREREYEELVKAAHQQQNKEVKNPSDEQHRDKIIKRLLEEEARRKQQEEARQKLMSQGVCPVGYHWIRQAGGYRCAGGSHYMSDERMLDL